MNTYFKYTLSLLAISTIAFSSCSDDENVMEKPVEPVQGKDLIQFTGDGNLLSRAGMATRAGNGELISFGSTTKIALRIKSEGKTSTDVRYTLTEMQADPASSCTDAMHKEAAGKNGSVQAEHDHLVYSGTTSYRYWDDAFGRDAKLSVYAVAVPGKTDRNLSAILKGKDNTAAPAVSATNTDWFTETGSNSQRSEDETFVWEVNSTAGQTASTIADQDICYSNNIRSRAEENDDADKGVYRFSYANSSWSFLQMEAGRMQWTPKSQVEGETVGKFDQGHLIFRHALSKVTINLTEATDTSEKVYGFNNSSADDFKFTVSGKNVELIGFPVKNTFDLATASWSTESSKITNANISFLNEITGATATAIQTRTVTGLVIPGKTLYEVSDNAMRFVIDNNDYYVTCSQIANAIRTYYDTGAGKEHARASELKAFTTMKQGDHYVINITIGKTKIENITAQLVDWEEVQTDPITTKNSYVTVNLESRTGTHIENVTDGNKFNLYRAAETAELNSAITGNDTYYNSIVKFGWKTGYIAATTDGNASNVEQHAKDKATKSYDSDAKRWETSWFWPDNKTYYHFRAVGNTEGNETTPSDVIIYKHATNGDYYKITSGQIGGTSYKDYTWGAPFVKKTIATDKFFYSKAKGFDATSKGDAQNVDGAEQSHHQIYKAIGAADPTTQNINLMMFHMTSQITLNVTTTTDESRVDLGDGTTVELLHFYKDGTVLVGNGLVAPVTTAVQDKGDFMCYPDEHIDYDGTANPKVAEKSVFRYGVVPQPLAFTNNSTDYKIGIRIKTKDNNQYVVNDISTIYATVTSNHLNIPYAAGTDTNSGSYLINEWYPGYKYTYTVTIKKTGIVNITAQLVDWETVTGDLGEITLEDKD